jgi:hypothetical protein
MVYKKKNNDSGIIAFGVFIYRVGFFKLYESLHNSNGGLNDTEKINDQRFEL